MNEELTYSVDYWKSFYSNRIRIITSAPSQFAEFSLPYMQRDSEVLDVCCGNGRDSNYFKLNGINVTSFDIISMEPVFFKYKELDLLNKTPNFGYDKKFDYVYCRFTLHSVPEEIEDYILQNAHAVLKDKGLLFIEVRSDKGVLHGGMNNHYRRLINFDKLKNKLIRLGFSMDYEIESTKLSVYNGEDPLLIRIVAKRSHVLNPEICKELLLTTKKVLDENNIMFFLIFGTLLGAYRDGDFIPYDSDVDIGLLLEDRYKVLKLVQTGEFRKYGMQFSTNGFRKLNAFTFNGERIDLFFFRKKYDIYKCLSFYIDTKHIENGLDEIEFLGTKFRTVRFIEDYLKGCYGEDWATPIKGLHALR